MTDFGKWVKGATDLRVAVGIILLAITAIFSLGAASMGALNNATEMPKRMDRFEAVQDTLVHRMDTLEPSVAFLYCLAKKEAGGEEINEFTCDDNGRD